MVCACLCPCMHVNWHSIIAHHQCHLYSQFIADSNTCFPSLLTDEEMTEQVKDRTTLVLATVAKKVKHSHSKWANSVVQKLENRLGVHGIYSHTLFLYSITD